MKFYLLLRRNESAGCSRPLTRRGHATTRAMRGGMISLEAGTRGPMRIQQAITGVQQAQKDRSLSRGPEFFDIMKFWALTRTNIRPFFFSRLVLHRCNLVQGSNHSFITDVQNSCLWLGLCTGPGPNHTQKQNSRYSVCGPWSS